MTNTNLMQTPRNVLIFFLLFFAATSCTNKKKGVESVENKHYEFHQGYVSFLNQQKKRIDSSFDNAIEALEKQESERVVLGQVENLDLYIYELECKAEVFCANRVFPVDSRLSVVSSQLRIKSAKIESDISNQYYLGVVLELKEKRIEFNNIIQSELKDEQDYLKKFKDEYYSN